MRPLVLLLLVTALAAADGPRIAIWDPGTNAQTSRFVLDRDYLQRVAGWLEAGGAEVAWLDAAALADPQRLAAEHFDGVVFFHESVPRQALDALERYASAGGVLVNLGAPVPFFIRVAREGDDWNLSPSKPKYRWQSSQLIDALGLGFSTKDSMNDIGGRHRATPLLRRYLDAEPPEVAALYEHRWLYPKDGATIHPLIASERLDGAAVTPQLFVVQRGTARAIVASATHRVFTGEGDTARWPLGPQTVVAIARIARDLARGELALGADTAAAVPTQELAPLAPLAIRAPTEGVDPEGWGVVARWGRFNGSSLELPERADGAGLQRTLAGGERLRLPLDARRPRTPVVLRVRGAYASSEVALVATLGGERLLAERFVFHGGGESQDVVAPGAEGDAEIEFTRLAYVPPGVWGEAIELHNPGSGTLYLDAVQLEQRDGELPVRWLGLGVGAPQHRGFPDDPTPRDESRNWSCTRGTVRTQQTGPAGSADRFADVDRYMARFLDQNPRPQVIFEGTPRWAASSQTRFDNLERKFTTVPDIEAFGQIVEHVVRTWGDRIDYWEIWNEANTRQFWAGSAEEYVPFYFAMAEIIERHDPGATITHFGFAGSPLKMDQVDPWLIALVEAGVLAHSDLLPIHCYHGHGAWDVRFGRFAGHVYNLGVDKPIYANEQGFHRGKLEGDDPAQSQRILLEVALARLSAEGCAKINVFHAGGDETDYGLFDAQGRPRPAYEPFKAYHRLAEDGGRRLDVALLPAGDEPLAGVYAAAAQHNDGSVSLIVNPVDGPHREPFSRRAAWQAPGAAVVVRVPLPAAGGWQAAADDGSAPQVELHAGAEPWAELRLDLRDRRLIRLTRP